MKLQKKVSLGQFAKAKQDFNDGDILAILDAGTIIQGKFGEQHVFQVRLPSNESKNLALNNTSLNKLIDAYGDDTEQWKGKNVKAWIVKMMVSNKMTDVVYVTAPDQELE